MDWQTALCAMVLCDAIKVEVIWVKAIALLEVITEYWNPSYRRMKAELMTHP